MKTTDQLLRPEDFRRVQLMRGLVSEKFVTEILANPSTMPYHSTAHCLAVAEGCLILGARDPEIIQAALLHDYGHVGNADDSVNVAQAVAKGRALGVSDAVINLVQATRYPYFEKDVPLEVQIIRDGDLAFSNLLVDDADYFRVKFSEEIGREYSREDVIDFLSTNGVYLEKTKNLIAKAVG